MKIHRLSVLAILGVFLLSSIAFAQNIQTNTTSTTLGSTQFGFEPDQEFIEIIMQLDTAASGNLDCDTRTGGVMTCTSTGADAANPDSTDFVRLDGLPGSFTDSARPGVINGMVGTGPGRTGTPDINFACGQQGAINSNGCFGLFQPNTASLQTAPNAAAQDPSGRDFIGVLRNSVSFGTGATTAPNGFSSFVVDSTLAANNASIDQFIQSSVSLGGTQNMDFAQRDATLMDPTGNTFATTIPDLATATQGDLDASLTGFTSAAAVGTMPARVNLLSRLTINQDGAADPEGNFGGMNLDVQVRFSGDNSAANTPDSGDFLTPGLNTGINPSAGSGFGTEWNGQAFP